MAKIKKFSNNNQVLITVIKRFLINFFFLNNGLRLRLILIEVLSEKKVPVIEFIDNLVIKFETRVKMVSKSMTVLWVSDQSIFLLSNKTRFTCLRILD